MSTTTKKLSPAQQRMLAEIDSLGSSSAPWGNSDSGRLASAWHRTARSLWDLGLVYYRGDGQVCRALSDEKKAAGLKTHLEALEIARSDLRSLPTTAWGATVARAQARVDEARFSANDFCERHRMEKPAAVLSSRTRF